MKISSSIFYSLVLVMFFLSTKLNAQREMPADSLPVKGLAVAVPSVERVDDFVNFIQKELEPRNVNTLILRVDYKYNYQSHPELVENDPLQKSDVKKIVNVCRENGIRIIPQINLLGHQSWHSDLKKLLEVYPEFDETPGVDLPDEYEWPNRDDLYCKSYCPLHPDVHKVVFDLVDEILEVFEADAFHAGMDEVFYLGHSKCPRCSGRDKAELFAGEVRRVRDHLADQGAELWIWGDRLIDGKTTGIGMWEGSMNNTYWAIDLIPKDVFICDWHYERADPTAVYFAMEGLRVATCPWRSPKLARKQVQNMIAFRQSSTPEMKQNFRGMIQTVWSSADEFMDEFYNNEGQEASKSAAACFRAMFDEIQQLEGKSGA